MICDLRGVRRRRRRGDVRFELVVAELSLEPGRFVAVVGDSGCGKSTLLDLIALVLRPDDGGRFQVAGVDVAALWAADDEAALAALRRRNLGYVLQTGGLLPFLTVAENLRLPARLAGRPVRGAELADLAERLGIADTLDHKPGRLSGGQRQRAAVLRALIHRPALVLADEPTAAVDKPRARAMVADFKALARERDTTIIMVTHDHDLVRDVADGVFGFDLADDGAGGVRSVCRARGAL